LENKIMSFHALKDLVQEFSAVLVESKASDIEIIDGLRHLKSLIDFSEYCIVKNWLIVNLDISEQEAVHFQRHSVIPMFIYAETIVEDSKQRNFQWIRTTLIKEKHSDFVFSTQNTNYFLVGHGYSCSMTIGHAYRYFDF